MARDPLRLRDPKNPRNWELVCQFCGAAWPHTSTLGEVIVPHFEKEHPGRGIRFLTKWVGMGKAPKTLPSSLSPS